RTSLPPCFTCLAESGAVQLRAHWLFAIRKEDGMQAPHRLFRFRFFHQKRQSSVRAALADDANLQVRHSGENSAGHTWLAADIFADQANQSLVIFPGDARHTMQIGSYPGQSRGCPDHERNSAA